MKTLSLLLIAVCLSLSAFSRVRTFPPEYGYKVLNSVVVDSVLIVRFLVTFDGKERVAVVREDCNCIVTRKVAVALFGFTNFKYVSRKELSIVYSVLQKL